MLLRTRDPRRRLTASVLLLAACAPAAASKWGPECVAPANPGGGWDITCRTTAAALDELGLIRGPMQVTNTPGDGGAVAFARVVARSAEGDTPLVAASPSTLIGIAQRRYSAGTERDVRWVAAVAAEPSVIAVSARSRWRTLDDFVAAWRSHPERIAVGGGSAPGGQDHMKILTLARAVGVDVHRVRYVPFNGGGEAVASLLADSVDVFPGDASEIQRHLQERTLRVLAVLGTGRATGLLAGVPTARELGYDVEWLVWRGFYAPKQMSEAEYAGWVEAFRTLSRSQHWKRVTDANGLAPYFIGGPEFEDFVYRRVHTLRAMSDSLGLARCGPPERCADSVVARAVTEAAAGQVENGGRAGRHRGR